MTLSPMGAARHALAHAAPPAAISWTVTPTARVSAQAMANAQAQFLDRAETVRNRLDRIDSV